MRCDWRQALPVLHGDGFTMREVARADASSLLDTTSNGDVTRFITPPPDTREGFERFIDWAQTQRRDGRFACFAVVPNGSGAPVGVFQIQRDQASSDAAEWGFVLGAQTWGSGLFVGGAHQIIDFAFHEMKLRRLEARAAVANVRGNRALSKIGAIREGVVKTGLIRHGERLDQNVWTILDRDWQRSKAVWGPKIAA